ncbi:MAG: hypothetical protein ACM3O3_12690 [Syntrophothermus sp.]
MLNDLVQGKEYRYELYLCKPYTTIVSSTPNHEIISCLTACSTITNVNRQLQGVNELDFDIAKYWNDKNKTVNTNFALIKEGQVILLQAFIDDTVNYSEYLYIYECEYNGVEKETKSIKCYSKYYQWNKMKIRQFQDSDSFTATREIYNGTTFDAATPEAGGIIDYIIQEKLYNTWTVSYISASLQGKYRTFDISEQSLLDVVRTVEGMYNCVFFFDTMSHSISIKDYTELPSETGLIVSGENYLKNIKENIKIDEIITRLYVTGKDITIAGVNVTGQQYLDDFTYFKSTDYMSQGLIDALDAYNVKKDSYTATYAGYQSDLTTKQGELSTLTQELSDLQTQLIVCEDDEDSCIKFGSLVAGVLTWEGQTWEQIHNATQAKQAEITSKQSEIDAKNAEITIITNALLAIGADLDYENISNFTTAQLQELLQFINEDNVSCETDDEAELLLYGQAILELRATPPIEFTLDMIDVFNFKSENYAWDKLVLGGIIDVEFPDLNIQSKPRIVGFSHNPDGQSLSVQVSNKPYLNDDLSYVSNIIALSRKTSTIVDNERDTYKEYSVDKDTIVKSGDTIDTTNNPVESVNSVELSRRGMWMKKIREASTAELRILEDKILISKDNWETFATAITSDGVYCTSLWVLTNDDGSVQIDGNKIAITNMQLDMVANEGYNEIIINPADGIEILQGTTPVFYANESGSLYLKNVYIGNEDGSIDITPNLISITNGKIIIKDANGGSTMIDGYGIDPLYLDYFKNMVYNSGFEVYDTTTNVASYWTGGVTSADSNFQGSRSMKLTAGESTIQSDSAQIDPSWYENAVSRVSFYRKFGQCKVEVYDVTNADYFTLTDNSDVTPVTGKSITYDSTINWAGSKATFNFDPTEYGTCSALKIKFTNVHATDALYIDCVQLHPDFTGKWAQIYKPGPNSESARLIGDFETVVNEVVQAIYVQNDAPATPLEDDVWIDTNDYSRYDMLTVTGNTSVNMSDEEFILITTSGVTVTLQTPTQSGVVKLIKNASDDYVTISGSIDNLSSKILYPYESLSLISGNLVWNIM